MFKEDRIAILSPLGLLLQAGYTWFPDYVGEIRQTWTELRINLRVGFPHHKPFLPNIAYTQRDQLCAPVGWAEMG